MGWRLGQGIGPRVSYEKRLQQDRDAGVPPTLLEDDEEARKHTYPPRDIKVVSVKRKDNAHGLGYDPGMSLNDSLGVKDGNNQGQTGAEISGEWFYIATIAFSLIGLQLVLVWVL